MRPARILIIRGGAIGDFILTLPALCALRARWPDAYLELWGYPHVARLGLRGRLVDRVESLDRAHMARFFSWRPGVPEDQAEHVRSFDIVINYLHDPDGLVADNLRRSGAKVVIACSPLVTDGPAVDHFLAPLESLAIYAKGAPSALPGDPEAATRGRERLRQAGAGEGPVVMHPGSGSPRKNWPAARFAELGARVADRAPAVFLAGEADAAAVAELRRANPTLPVLEGLDLEQVADVLSAAAAYVGNDSGISHLAAAAGIPALVLFGPTDPAIWAPRAPLVRVLPSPTGEMDGLPVDAVLDALREVLDRRGTA